MTNKIGGYGNRPVQNGTDKSYRASAMRDVGVAVGQGGKAATPVKITDQARQLAALERP